MNKNFKVGAVTVLYNPPIEVYENICTYLDLVEHLFVCDNSENKNEELLNKLKDNNKITIIDMNGNQGIAKALKIGTQKCIDNNYDFCLTMDQDSKFPTDKMDEISSYLTMDNIDDYGIIGLNINKIELEKKIIEVKTWITSGNFINLKSYKLIDGFKEELFIDLVDVNLCEQFYNINKKVAYINNISLIHQIGTRVTKRFLFFRRNFSSYATIRYYYIIRNSIYLYKLNKNFYKNGRFSYLKLFFKVLLIEQNKREKIKMIKRGKKDAKKDVLGKYYQN